MGFTLLAEKFIVYIAKCPRLQASQEFLEIGKGCDGSQWEHGGEVAEIDHELEAEMNETSSRCN